MFDAIEITIKQLKTRQERDTESFLSRNDSNNYYTPASYRNRKGIILKVYLHPLDQSRLITD